LPQRTTPTPSLFFGDPVETPEKLAKRQSDFFPMLRL